MEKFNILVLTDHTNHSKENSLYALLHNLRAHPKCGEVDVATRGEPLNKMFFERLMTKRIFVAKADESFKFSPEGKSFKKNLRRESVKIYDVVWLRLPPPLSRDFLEFLEKEFPSQMIINNPKGILETGSKEFLLNFPEICPPMQVCDSVESIISMKEKMPIVLKPFREYGGKGIVRIDGNKVWEGKEESTFEDFISKIQNTDFQYLGVKFLKNVSEGDKRIIVVNGEIIGASLRLPAENSWLCNVAQGGRSVQTEVTEEERNIVATIHPKLSEMGVIMYGVDTLVNDEGKRILSEINTTSIGGVPQLAAQTGKPLVRKTTNLIWEFIIR